MGSIRAAVSPLPSLTSLHHPPTPPPLSLAEEEQLPRDGGEGEKIAEEEH